MCNFAAELKHVANKEKLVDIQWNNTFKRAFLKSNKKTKMAESVKQPLSYSRVTKILSSVGGKITIPTTSSYIDIQVSYSIDRSDTTEKREVEALQKLPKVLSCKRRVIITYDEEKAIEDEYGVIEVIPCWKWLIQ
jgi:predicted AAA+ superfamily ATPase